MATKAEMSRGNRMTDSGDRDLGLRPATDLLALLRDRTISSRELLTHFLDRNEQLHGDINAIVTLDVSGAFEAAAAADERRAADEAHGALDGLPMTVKDALAVEGVRATGGAIELADNIADVDSEAVSRVRDAGAVVFGKTNLPRWSGDAQATNEIFGTTNNPWDLTRGPGGSSGGASAALAAGLTPLEIGTDIGGSVRLPAHFAGVCGHKPSFGIVSQLGYVDHVSYGSGEADVNVVGPMARTVDDLALLFDVLIGPTNDLAEAWSLELPKPRGVASDLRVAAWLDDPACPVSSAVAVVMDAAADAVERDGVSVNRSARPAHPFDDVRSVGLPLISAATSPARTDAEFAEQAAIARDPGDAEPTMIMRSTASAMLHRDWTLLTERRTANRKSWKDFFRDFDVLLAPVAMVPAFKHQTGGTLYTRTLDVDGTSRNYSDLIVWTSQFGYVYLPSTVVPVGATPEGLPIGIQVVGPFLGDRTTLEFARYLERLFGGYQVPPMAVLS